MVVEFLKRPSVERWPLHMLTLEKHEMFNPVAKGAIKKRSIRSPKGSPIRPKVSSSWSSPSRRLLPPKRSRASQAFSLSQPSWKATPTSVRFQVLLPTPASLPHCLIPNLPIQPA